MDYRSVVSLLFLFLVTIALASCAAAPGTQVAGTPAAAKTGGARASHSDCPLSVPSIAKPPDSEYRDPLPRGLYFISDDTAIWAMVEPWRQGTRKVLWLKPVGSELAVRGRRLDGEAPPLWAALADGYAGDFQASWLIFPTAGCWEVEARANASVLRFVYYITPQQALAQEPACARIGDVVKPDRVIIVGRVEKRAPGAGGRWAWLSVRVTQNLFPNSVYRESVSVGDALPVLQDGAREPLLEEGSDYVLALHGDPWRIVCPHQTVAAVYTAREHARVTPLAPEQSLWSGETVAEIQARIQAAYRARRNG